MIAATIFSLNLVVMFLAIGMVLMARLNWRNEKLTLDNADETNACPIDTETNMSIHYVPTGEIWKFVKGDDVLIDLESTVPAQVTDGVFHLDACNNNLLTHKPYSHHDNSLTPTWAQQKSVEYRPHKVAGTFAVLGAVANKFVVGVNVGVAVVIANSNMSINVFKATLDPTAQIRKYKKWVLE